MIFDQDRSLVPLHRDIKRNLLEILGVQSKFERTQSVGDNTKTTDLIPLPGVNLQGEAVYYFNIAHRNSRRNIFQYSTVLFINTPQGFRPVAHMNYESIPDSQHCITADTFSELITALKAGYTDEKHYPDWLVAIEKGGGGFDIQIDEPYRDQKLSKPLIYLTLAQAELDGYDKMYIGGDATREKIDGQAAGLYVHLGAKDESVTVPVITTKRLPNGKITVAETGAGKSESISFNTVLSADQSRIVQKVLGL